MRPIVWISESISHVLRERVPEAEWVTSAAAFVRAPRDASTVSFVDGSTIAEVERAAKVASGSPVPGPVIAICDGTLPSAIPWLEKFGWLSHVVSVAMLQHPMAVEHLGNVMSTLTQTGRPKLLNWLGPEVAGRRIRVTQASRRAERVDRIGDFFDSKGVSARTVRLLRDSAEELLTNAFYDAPVAAGVVKQAISRTQDVSVPDGSACDLVYACSDDLAIVRVRDPFGSLTRKRIVEVLMRCVRQDMQVQVDESMGGAGLGLWRIFTAASFVAISVVNHRHTEVLVGIGKRVTSGPRPFAFHLFFNEGTKRRFWKLLDDDSESISIYESYSLDDGAKKP